VAAYIGINSDSQVQVTDLRSQISFDVLGHHLEPDPERPPSPASLFGHLGQALGAHDEQGDQQQTATSLQPNPPSSMSTSHGTVRAWWRSCRQALHGRV